MKPFLPFNNQLNLLKSRHLVIKSEKEAVLILKAENYYRLSGYFKLFTKPGSDDFVDGFSFYDLLKIYRFDTELRLLLNKYLAIVEIAARTRIAYNLARITCPDSYLNPSNFNNSSHHTIFIDEINKERRRSSRNPIVSHFVGENIPIWVLVEIMTFGVISKMFANLKKNLQNEICLSPEYEKVYVRQRYENYLQITCNLRNVCAHHGRLYGKRFPYNISLSRGDIDLFNKYGYAIPSNSSSSTFELIFAMFKLIPNNDDKKEFRKSLKKIFFKYRKYIDLKKLGFYNKWDLVLKEC